MYDITKADEIFDKMSTDEKVNKVFEVFKDKMPSEYCALMYMIEYGCHIVTRELYDKAVALLKWSKNKGQGAKWDVQRIVELANIDFESPEVDYYEYDFAYVVNVLYSDYCEIFTDPNYYIKMAKAYLEDPDYMGDPSERAYHDAVERIRYHSEK